MRTLCFLYTAQLPQNNILSLQKKRKKNALRQNKGNTLLALQTCRATRKGTQTTAATYGKKGLRLRARIHGKNKPATGESVTGFVNTY